VQRSSPGTRRHGKSLRDANASDTDGFKYAPKTAPMNRASGQGTD